LTQKEIATPWLDITFCTGALSKQKQHDMVAGSRNRGNVEAFRNLSADYLVQLPEFTRSTTLRWTFWVASIFAASQLTDYIETIGAPKGAIVYMSLGEVVWRQPGRTTVA
jgi:hypothetical protein